MFNKIPRRDFISWIPIITGYAKNGKGEEALKLFAEMHKEGCKLNQFTFPSFLKACANIAAHGAGKHVHYHAIRSGFEVDIYVGNALVDLDAKCVSVHDA